MSKAETLAKLQSLLARVRSRSSARARDAAPQAPFYAAPVPPAETVASPRVVAPMAPSIRTLRPGAMDSVAGASPAPMASANQGTPNAANPGPMTAGATGPGTASPGAMTASAVSPSAVSPGAMTAGAVGSGAMTAGAVGPGPMTAGAVSPGPMTAGAVSAGTTPGAAPGSTGRSETMRPVAPIPQPALPVGTTPAEMSLGPAATPSAYTSSDDAPEGMIDTAAGEIEVDVEIDLAEPMAEPIAAPNTYPNLPPELTGRDSESAERLVAAQPVGFGVREELRLDPAPSHLSPLGQSGAAATHSAELPSPFESGKPGVGAREATDERSMLGRAASAGDDDFAAEAATGSAASFVAPAPGAAFGSAESADAGAAAAHGDDEVEAAASSSRRPLDPEPEERLAELAFGTGEAPPPRHTPPPESGRVPAAAPDEFDADNADITGVRDSMGMIKEGPMRSSVQPSFQALVPEATRADLGSGEAVMDVFGDARRFSPETFLALLDASLSL